MTISRDTLIAELEQLLEPGQIKDYCPNGLQVEGRSAIRKVVTGVTASQALIDAAVAADADALLVHHGFFWKGENPVVKGMKRKRLQALLSNDINLLAYHLPLDIHPELGNNAQLAALLGITGMRGLEPGNPRSVPVRGEFAEPVTVADLAARIERQLARTPLVCGEPDRLIKTVAWCTGGGQGFIDLAAEQGIDAFISGEASEQTIHSAREQGIAFFAAGHHATERYGVKALGEWLAQTQSLDVEFIDIDNPV